MSNTVVGFTIDIDGIQTINQLNEAISKTKKEMKDVSLVTEEGKKEYAELGQKLGQLEAQNKALKKAQDDVNKSFLPEKAVGAYDKASAQLNKLRKEFKNAALDGSKSAKELDALQKEIQQLDKTLKDVDGQVGQFQRSVGDYPRTFRRVTRALYTAIPGFEAFSGTLQNGEGRLSTFGKALIGGFVAFQAANLINNAITKLDEFNKKIQQTRDVVLQMSGAYGESLDSLTARTSALSETFGADAKTISEAAKALAQSMGISFEEALGKLENTLVEGRGDANDYLNKIKEMPKAFIEAGSAVSDIAQDNRRLLESNQELAKGQIAVSKQTRELVTSFKEFKNAATGAAINVLLTLYEALKPIGMAFYNLGKAVGDWIGMIIRMFNPTNQSVNVLEMLGYTIRLLLSPITFLINLIAGITESMIQFAPIIRSLAIGIGIFTAAMNAARIAAALGAVAQGVYAAAIAGYEAVVKTAKAMQLAFNAAVRANPAGLIISGIIAAGGAIAAYTLTTEDATDAIEDNSEAMKKHKAQLDAEMAAAEKAAEAKAKQQQDEFDKQAKIDEANRKAEQAAADALAKYNQQVEKLNTDRKKFLEDEANETKNTLALLAELRARYIEEQISNIKSDRERQIAELKNNTKKQIEALDEQFNKLREENTKRQKEADAQLAEAIRLRFSKEDIDKIRAENQKQREADAKEEQEVSAQIADIKTEINKKLNTDINNANEEFRKEDLEKAKESAEELRDFRDRILKEELEYISFNSELKLLKNKEELEKRLAQETDEKKREAIMKEAAERDIALKINEIQQQTRALDDQKEYLDSQKKLGVDVKQEEYDAIVMAKQKLNTELAELDNQQVENSKKAAEATLKANLDTFNKILGYIKTGVDVISEAIQVANDRQMAAFEKDLERSQERQAMFEEELQNSTGLRRLYYEQQLERELRNQQELEQKKEQLAKKAAKQQKAVAVIQSIINTALAVSAALATPVAPNVVAATIAGIAGAAQTAIIAAQPLAAGGVVGKLGKDIVQFSEGGKVTSAGNIRPLSNGDNVLATLKTGEVVLNESQQKRIGYSTLKAARIPNFAAGGVVGAPSAFLAQQMSTVSEEKQRIELMEKMVLETSSRIDRIQVVYTASTEDSVDKARAERKEIKTTAQF